MKKLIIIYTCIACTVLSCSQGTKDYQESKSTKSETKTRNQVGKVIGEVNNGTITITYELETLKSKWNRFLKVVSNSELDLNLQTVFIEYDAASERYFLHGSDSFNNAKTAMALTKDGNLLRESTDGKTVVCSGCTSTGPNSATECDVKFNPELQGYYCTDCSTNNCSKTVTHSEELMF